MNKKLEHIKQLMKKSARLLFPDIPSNCWTMISTEWCDNTFMVHYQTGSLNGDRYKELFYNYPEHVQLIRIEFYDKYMILCLEAQNKSMEIPLFKL